MAEPIKITIEMNSNYGKTDIVDQIKSALAKKKIGLKCIGEDYIEGGLIALKFRY